jgi:hypothetical protein
MVSPPPCRRAWYLHISSSAPPPAPAPTQLGDPATAGPLPPSLPSSGSSPPPLHLRLCSHVRFLCSCTSVALSLTAYISCSHPPSASALAASAPTPTPIPPMTPFLCHWPLALADPPCLPPLPPLLPPQAHQRGAAAGQRAGGSRRFFSPHMGQRSGRARRAVRGQHPLQAVRGPRSWPRSGRKAGSWGQVSSRPGPLQHQAHQRGAAAGQRAASALFSPRCSGEAGAEQGGGSHAPLPDLVLVLAPIRFCCLPVTRI